MSACASRPSRRCSFIGVRAEPGGRRRAHLDGAAERVAVLPRGVDRGVHLLDVSPPNSRTRPSTAIPIVGEQRLRDAAGRDEHRGVARARALERVADVVVLVLEDAREIRVAGTRQRDRLRPLARAARPRAARGSSPTSSSCGRGSGRRARAASRASAPGEGRRAPRAGRSRSAGAGCGRSPAGAARGRLDRLAVELEPRGQPFDDRDEAGPCDSPAVVSARVTGASLLRTAARIAPTGAGDTGPALE